MQTVPTRIRRRTSEQSAPHLLAGASKFLPPRSALAGAVSIAAAFLLSSPAAAKSWYLDGLNGGGQYAAGTAAAPFSKLWMALKHVMPGDTIYVVPSMTYPMLGLTANGTATAPIRLQGSDPKHLTKVSGGGVDSGIWIDGNYLVVRNFDVTSPGNWTAISIAPHFHHITIDNNIVHDAGGTGINTIANDYITITNNVVYGNASNTTTAFGSGISILGSVDVDNNTGYKVKVLDNIVYSNANVPNCSTPSCFATSQDSDGNGIILDNNKRLGMDNVPYKGAILVANNVVYNNGGRGIHVYATDNAKITNNTLYENNKDPYEGFWHPGEVAVVNGGAITIADNILYSDGLNGRNLTGTAPNYHTVLAFEHCSDGAGPITVRNNLGFNPQANNAFLSYLQANTNAVNLLANTFADPMFVNAAQADFRFRAGSPANGASNGVDAIASDIMKVNRMPFPSMGAYQAAVN